MIDDQSKREQRFQSGLHFIKHACWSLAYETRSSLLPGGAAQLIGLYNTADLVVVRYWHVKAPVVITPRYRAGSVRPANNFYSSASDRGLKSKVIGRQDQIIGQQSQELILILRYMYRRSRDHMRAARLLY